MARRSAVVEFLERELSVAEGKLERHHLRTMNAFKWHSLKMDMEEELYVIKRLLRKARKAPAAGAKGG